MTIQDFCSRVIRLIASVVPHGLRQEWQQEWEAEVLHYSEELQANGDLNLFTKADMVLRCFGSVFDALWLRRNEWSLDMLFEDLKYAVRQLVQKPAFAVVVISILGLGIGANAAVFSVIDAVLLRPLPYGDPDRIVTIWDTNAAQARTHEGPSPANLEDWRKRSKSFDGITSWYAGKPVTLQTAQDSEKVVTAEVTADFFEVFGRRPLLGRAFDKGEYTQEARVVVLSQPFWQRRFGGREEVLGSRIVLDGSEYVVVGIMPADFAMPNKAVGIWKPKDFSISYASRPGGVPRDARFLRVAARLRDGRTLAQAHDEMTGIVADLEAEYPAVNRGWGVRLIPLKDEVLGDVRTPLMILLGSVGLVLLIACTNIASLFLARASSRGREIAVRAAIGASRLRIIRQLLTESLVLASAGGILGLFIAYWGVRLLTSIAPEGTPRLDEVSINLTVLGFTGCISLLTGLLFGIMPALLTSRPSLASTLKENMSRGATAAAGTRRFRSALVVCEIALALTLLIAASLLMRSFTRLINVDPGFDYNNILVVRAFPDERAYSDSSKRLAYFRALKTRLEGLPTVESVGATTGLPLSEFNNAPARPYWREGDPPPGADGPKATLKMTTKDYFKTMGISLLSGRDFSDFDTQDAPAVAIVNSVFARSVWPGEEAVGKRLIIDYMARGAYPYEVIGVVEGSRVDGLRKEAPVEIFLAHTQVTYAQMNFVLRTSGDPAAVARAAQREVLELDPAQPVHSVTTMEQLISRSIAQDRFSVTLILVLSMLALCLALSGVYGVMSYTVTQRTHEIGVRVALGAKRSDVMKMILAHAGSVALIGITAGMLASLLLSRALSTMVYEVSTTDAFTFASAPLVLAAACLIAGYIPARRATGIDPVQVLRND